MSEQELPLDANFDLDACFDPVRGKRVALLRERYRNWVECAAAKPSPEAAVAVEALDLAITLMDGRPKLYHPAPGLVALGWLKGPTPPPPPPPPLAPPARLRFHPLRKLSTARWEWRRGQFKHELVATDGEVLATATSMYGAGWRVTQKVNGVERTFAQAATVAEAKALGVSRLVQIYDDEDVAD